MFGSSSWAVTTNVSILSNEQLFRRCYALLTAKAPQSTHSLLVEVKSNVRDPIAACMMVFDRGSLDASGNLYQRNSGNLEISSDAISVFENFYNTHRTWFDPDDFESVYPTSCQLNADILDDADSALHVTRALLSPNVQFSEVFTGGALEAQRDLGVPNATQGTFSLLPLSSFFQINYNPSSQKLFMEMGRLTGIVPMNLGHGRHDVYATVVDDTSAILPNYVYFNRPLNQGTGVLGSSSYFLLNSGRNLFQKMNGGVLMHRRWAKKIAKDFLVGRELPLMRYADAAPFVQQNSLLSFRNGQGCMSCHGTMDNLAKAVRGVSIMPTRANCRTDQNEYQTLHPYIWSVSQPAHVGAEPDDDPQFHLRPPQGRLFFRSYSGSAIDLTFNNLSELAQLIAHSPSFDDPYIAIAQKYFKYFTGIDVLLSDSGDPNSMLTTEQVHYRDVLIPLGRSLKSHQSLRQLIQDILSTSEFRRVDLRTFGE